MHSARFAQKPKILILDDSTSAVDTKTDALIRQAFREELPDVTKFIIAQRVSSVEDADLIIIMNNGEVAAQGTHEELLATNEIYQEVYYSQNKIGAGAEELKKSVNRKEVTPNETQNGNSERQRVENPR